MFCIFVEITETCSALRDYPYFSSRGPDASARCFKQIWKVGRVGMVGKVGKVGKAGMVGKVGRVGKVGKVGKTGKKGRLRE